MRTIRIASLTVVIAAAFAAAAAPGQARASETCTWGGTATEPTGWFTVSPGVTATPAPGPLRFAATGELGGNDPRCHGPMKFVGHIGAGSTCAASSFEGRVKGLPGVARFQGFGSLLVPSRLYDRAGNVVGVENANIMTPHNQPLTTDCLSPGGFTGPADFSSIVVLY